jgi:hypothetical protein
MALNAANLVVGQGGSILWGTTGISLPTTAVASVAAFTDLGYLDENGLKVTVTPTIQEFPVWQSKQPGRRGLQTQAIAISGACAEWNTASVPRVFGGGALTTGTYAFLSDTATLEEFATVADVVDGSDIHRFVFGRVNQTEAAEVQFNRQNLSVLPFSFGVLAPAAGGSPGNYYTNT